MAPDKSSPEPLTPMQIAHGAIGFLYFAITMPSVTGFLFFVGAPATVFGEVTYAISEPRIESAVATGLLVLLTLLSVRLGLRKRAALYGLMIASYALVLCWLTESFRLELALSFSGVAFGLIVLTVVNLHWLRLLFGPHRGTRRN